MGLETDLCEVVRIEDIAADRKSIEFHITQIIKELPDKELRQLLIVLKTLFPVKINSDQATK